MKLALGSVQFGTDYGISNAAGRVPDEEVERILAFAANAAIDLIDTAPAYGESEAVLGRLASAFRIVTKIGAIDFSRGDVRGQVRSSFDASLARLRRGRVYGLLAHRASDLAAPAGKEVAAAMRELVDEGRVEKIGVSVYEASEIDAAFAGGSLTLLQAPVSILDQRLLRSGHLAQLKANGVEIHARSVFLQGLLFLDPDRLDARFDGAREGLRAARGKIAEAGLSIAQAGLGFVLSRAEVDHVILGVCSERELRDAVAAASALPKDWRFADGCALGENPVLNPTRWAVAG